MRLLEDIRFRWAWRRRRLALPGRRDRDDASPYGYAVPRTGVAPAAVVAIVAAALALGGWLGLQTSSAGPRWLGPTTADPAGLLDLQAPATAAEADREAIAALNTARVDGRHDLATATRPSEQAAAALALRRANLRAAAGFDGDQEPLARALRRNATAYGQLARAAEAGDRRAYARASTAVASAERDLQRLIGSVL